MSALASVQLRFFSWPLRLPRLEPRRVLPLLTVVLLLVGTADWGLTCALLAAWFALGVSLPRLLRGAFFWYVTASILGTAVWFHWETADNHRYLYVYWTVALCGAFSLPRKEQLPALALSSRLLIGLCMGLAVVWKLVSPDYLSGSFFQYELLADKRFAHLSSWTSGLSLEQLAENRELREVLVGGHLKGTVVNEVQFHTASHISLVAQFLTWWTVGIEGLLAGLFLAAAMVRKPRLRVAANSSLLLFAATTYAVAPVRGFGAILMLLGLAQCRRDQKGWSYVFLAAFVLLQLCTLPLVDLVSLLR